MATTPSAPTLATANNQGMGIMEYSKIYDFYFRPSGLKLNYTPPRCILDILQISPNPTCGSIGWWSKGIERVDYDPAYSIFWLTAGPLNSTDSSDQSSSCASSNCWITVDP